jgi:tetratricopeptide (TPR) repeat protein
VILPYPTTSNVNLYRLNLSLRILLYTSLVSLSWSCASNSPDPVERPNIGLISYPFVGDGRPLGTTKPRRPFVVRSAVGAQEYSVEIPDNSAKYDIQIPLAELSPMNSQPFGATLPSADSKRLNPANTDQELISALPDLGKAKSGKTEMLDAAFGVGKPEGPIQSPSYTLGIARINQHFKSRNFELALVELNNLLAFYPNSPKLLKMKGTLLVKTGNRELAMKSWQRALDLAPGDLALKNSIHRLNERILAEKNARGVNNQILPNTNLHQSSPETLLDRVAH